MIKKIEIDSEVFKAAKRGMHVEGSVCIDTETGKLTFRAWKRKAPKCGDRGRIIMRTEHGWVKESKERIKTYESVPKTLGKKRITSILERDMYEVSDFLTEFL
ncbi:MAG: hypothetical protein J6W24_01080 [Prevotella sp.]|nr:hypothetical protein [Prevotella sp.]